MPINLLQKYDLRCFPNRINWEITHHCSFGCSYCVNRQVNKEIQAAKLSPDEIARCFEKTNKQWLILITGGEPFEYPDFVAVCSALTQKHHLQITSNLSSPEIMHFADTINPSQIFLISASFHAIQREKNASINDFTNKCQYLIEKGFPVLVNYLAHPDCFRRIAGDLQMLKDLQIETFVIPMRGVHQQLKYPEAYTREQWEVMEPFLLDENIEKESAFSRLNFYARRCEAGSHYFFMNPKGDISRCASLQKKTGNIFDGSFVYSVISRPCIAKNCNDVYCGVAAVTQKKASKLAVYCEEKYYQRLK